MSGIEAGEAGFLILLVLMFLRMPVGFAMTMIGLLGFAYLVSFGGAFNVVTAEIASTFISYFMAVVPLFVLMGALSFHSGATERLFAATHSWLGQRRGGLAIGTILVGAVFGAISGSSIAATATITMVAVPEMRKYNYGIRLACGTVVAAGSLDVLIPPSTVMIIYGILTEQSIGKLFLAGIIPGVLLSLLFMATIFIICWRFPEEGPPGPRTSFKEKLKAALGIIEMGILFGLVMGGLFAGWFTATEAAGVGAGGAFVIGLARRKLKWPQFTRSLMDTVRTTAIVFPILVGAMVFGRFLAVTEIPFKVSAWVAALAVPPSLIMIGVLMIYLIAGCFIESVAFMVLTIPVFYPLMISLGYDPIWFGIMLVLLGMIGALTPPVGMGIYIVTGILRDVPMATVFRGCYPFLPALAVGLILLVLFPEIITFLPSFLK